MHIHQLNMQMWGSMGAVDWLEDACWWLWLVWDHTEHGLQSNRTGADKNHRFTVKLTLRSNLVQIYELLQDYGLSFGRVPIFVDNMSAISIAKNPVLHSRTKHIDIRFHFLRDNHERGHIDLIHVPSERQTADILTKPLEQDTFARLRGELGVCYPF
jgi:hypothetical protein